jgi:hypothetical protein
MAQQPPPPSPSPVDIHIDLSGIADLIWRWFIDHVGELGTAILVPLENTLRAAAQAVWDAVWHSSANILTQIPPELSYNFGPYKAIATNPVPIAIGGATLALVLLGLRTITSALIGHDHLATHLLTRLIPAVFLTLAYPVLVARGIGLVNAVAEALGSQAIGGGVVSGLGRLLIFQAPGALPLLMPYMLVWLLLIYFGVRLLIRLAYGLFRLLVALIFGPVALILWAIPQTEWVTWFWLRELLGWMTTPLLVTACLAMAVPLASGRDGFLGAAVFGIAGMQAAYDLIGLLSVAQRSNSLLQTAFRELVELTGYAAKQSRAGMAAATGATNPSTSRNHYGYR